MALPDPLMLRRRAQPPHYGELLAPAHQHHGENFDGAPGAPQTEEPLAALIAALGGQSPIHGGGVNPRGADAGAGFTRARGPMSGMAGAHHGESMGNTAHHGENFAGGGLGLALGDWAHLPAPPPPGPGIHWFGPGGAGIAYPTPNGGGPEVFGPAGSHGEVYTPPMRRRPALAHALQVS
jgi:hypothetical protein